MNLTALYIIIIIGCIQLNNKSQGSLGIRDLHLPPPLPNPTANNPIQEKGGDNQKLHLKAKVFPSKLILFLD